MLYCRKCGSEVSESDLFCEKCTANLRLKDAVVNIYGRAADIAGKAVKEGKFMPDAFVDNFDFSGCNIGNYRIVSKLAECYGVDYYNAVDISDADKKISVHYFKITDKNLADKMKFITAHESYAAIQAEKVLRGNFNRSYLLNQTIHTFLTADKKVCHVFVSYEKMLPLSVMLKSEQLKIRDILKISIEICRQLADIERTGEKYNSIFESNIYIDSERAVFLGTEMDLELQRRCIISNVADIFAAYQPPDFDYECNNSVYMLAVMLYRMFNGGRLPYINYFKEAPDYTDFINFENNRRKYNELQLPVYAENMLGNMLVSIISNCNWSSILISDVRNTLENSLNFLSSAELDRIIF